MMRGTSNQTAHSESANLLNPKGVYVNLQDLIRLRLIAQDLDLFTRKKVSTPLKGLQSTRLRGRGMEFEEVRLYQPGDDIRSIDWRVTARTQKPHTKLFQEERERPLFVVVDQSASLFFGSKVCFKSVMAAHLGATLAWTGLKHNDRIGGMVLGDHFFTETKPRRSAQAVLQFIQQITQSNRSLQSPQVSASSDTRKISLADHLLHLRTIVKPGTCLFIVSDFYNFNAECEQHLAVMAKHASIQLIHVYDPLEQSLTNSQPLFATDGINRVRLESDQSYFQKAFNELFDARTAHLIDFAKKNRIHYLSVSTQEYLPDFFQTHFGKK